MVTKKWWQPDTKRKTPLYIKRKRKSGGKNLNARVFVTFQHKNELSTLFLKQFCVWTPSICFFPMSFYVAPNNGNLSFPVSVPPLTIFPTSICWNKHILRVHSKFECDIFVVLMSKAYSHITLINYYLFGKWKVVYDSLEFQHWKYSHLIQIPFFEI